MGKPSFDKAAAGNLGRLLKSARLSSGLRQRQVAEALGISPQAVCQWETGRSTPSTAQLPKLAALLRTDLVIRPPNSEQGEVNTARLRQVLISFVKENGAREGAFDALTPLERQPELVGDAMRLIAKIEVRQ